MKMGSISGLSKVLLSIFIVLSVLLVGQAAAKEQIIFSSSYLTIVKKGIRPYKSDYTVVMDNQIPGGNSSYYTLIKVLQTAGKFDTVTIHVYYNSGGSVFNVLDIADAINTSNAKVTYYVHGTAESAAASLVCLISNDKLRFSSKALLMFHKGRVYNFNDAGEIVLDEAASDAGNEAYVKPLLQKCVDRGLLTQAEFQKIFSGGYPDDNGPWVNISGVRIKHRLVR